jgi:hypothetical protein
MIGKFTKKFEASYKGHPVVLHVRGLLVGEMSDLISKDLITASLNRQFYIEIAKVCIVSWEGVGDGESELEYDPDFLDQFDETWVSSIGEFCYHKLTQLTEAQVDYYRAFIRMALIASEDQGELKMRKYKCDHCVKNNLWKRNLCGLTEEQRFIRSGTKSVEEEVVQADDLMSRYKNKSKTALRKKKHENPDFESPKQVVLGDIKLNECPRSIFIKNPEIEDLGGKLLYCHKNSVPFFTGGLADQSQRFYEIGSIVSSEVSRYESEQMDKAKKK